MKDPDGVQQEENKTSQNPSPIQVQSNRSNKSNESNDEMQSHNGSHVSLFLFWNFLVCG